MLTPNGLKILNAINNIGGHACVADLIPILTDLPETQLRRCIITLTELKYIGERNDVVFLMTKGKDEVNKI